MEHPDDIKELIRAKRRRLQILKEQLAYQGITVEPKIKIEIEDIEKELDELNARLPEAYEAEAARPPPYLGLQYFDVTDADLFFGRDQLTAKLVNYLQDHRFLAVVGASGSGKSSLVRAGLVPALRQSSPLANNTLPPEGSSHWPIHIITPSAHPLETLALTLTRESESVSSAKTLIKDLETDSLSLHLHVRKLLTQSPVSPLRQAVAHPASGNAKLLLLVDQFEELFTLCRDEAERSHFVDNLLSAVAPKTDGPTIVVITLRADFYHHCAQYATLRDALANHQEYIGSMSETELRQAIERPVKAAEYGYKFEAGLVDLLLHDVGREPGALPLLSHALLETWKRREGRTLTFKGYHDAGGVHGAIAQTAETVYRKKLNPVEQAIARRIFLALTELGEGTQDTRRRVSTEVLIPQGQDPGEVEDVLKTLVDARLVTTSEEGTEVAHEALIREWPALKRWLDANREALRIHRNLGEAAQEWQALSYDRGALYRGVRLDQALEWAEQHAAELTELEAKFLETSREAQEATQRQELEAARKLAEETEARRQAEAERAREAEARRQAEEERAQKAESLALVRAQSAANYRKWAIGLASIGAMALVFAITAGLFGVRSTREARRNQSLALAASAQEALSEKNSDLAVTLAIEANKIMEPAPIQAQRALANIAYHSPGTRRRLVGHTDRVNSAAFSPDGRTVVSGSADDTLILWDLETKQTEALSRRLTGHNDDVNSVAFSPDGTHILSGAADKLIILWDSETGQEIHRFAGHAASVNSVTFHPDGHIALSGSSDGTLILWDLNSNEKIQQIETGSNQINSVAFSPDGRYMVSGSEDNSICSWVVETAKKITCFPGATYGVKSMVVSADNQTVLIGTGGWGPGIYQWDFLDPQYRFALFGHAGGDTQVAYSPEGLRAVSGAYDNVLILWDLSNPQEQREIQRFIGHTDDITSVAFSPDGKRILSASADNSLRLWDLSSGAEIQQFVGAGGNIAFSPDGTSALIHAPGDINNSEDDKTFVWDIEMGRELRRLEFRGNAGNLVFSSDGGQVLLTAHRTVHLFDYTSGQKIRTFAEGHPGTVTSIAFSPDGRLALSGSYGDTRNLILWDVATGQIICTLDGHKDVVVRSVAFHPDGRRAISGADDHTVILWDIEKMAEIRRLEGHTGKITGVAFGLEGNTILSGSEDHSLRLWDTETGVEIRRFSGLPFTVSAVDFSPDGKTIISGSDEGSISIWDIETGQEMYRLKGHWRPVRQVLFSPHGRLAISRAWDQTVRIWQLETLQQEELIDWTYANRFVRELTCEERAKYQIEPSCNH